MRKILGLVLISSAAAGQDIGQRREDLKDAYLARDTASLLFESVSVSVKEKCAEEKAAADRLERAPDGGDAWQLWMPQERVPPEVRPAWQRLEKCLRDEHQRQQSEAAAAKQAKQDARRAAEAARDSDAHERAKDPKWRQEIMSGLLCAAQRERSFALEEIAKEKKYARLGGVVDMRAMKELQDQVREGDEGIAAAPRNAKALGVKTMLPCSNQRVADFAACVLVKGVLGQTECQADGVREMLEVESVIRGE